MDENEEKKGVEETKKDSLMWSEEDYDAMQRLTGFDEESVLEDQKKGINIVIFVIVCIISLIVGILIGYNINKKEEAPSPEIVITKENEEDVKILAFYNRLNASGELYLYALDSKNEEFSIFDLTSTHYAYQFIDGELYLLVSKDGLNLYNYSFSKDGYHRDLVKKFEDEYDAFYFKNNIILIKNKKDVKLYDNNAELLSEVEFDCDEIYDYTSEYVVYSRNNKLYIYYFKLESYKQLTKKDTSFVYLNSDQIFYIEKNKLYEYSIVGDTAKELINIKANSIFTKLKNNYIFNDGKVLYLYNKNIAKFKEFDYDISEIAYLDPDDIIIILDDYDSLDCLMGEKEFYLLNVKEIYLTEKRIDGCLNTQVINDLIKVK